MDESSSYQTVKLHCVVFLDGGWVILLIATQVFDPLNYITKVYMLHGLSYFFQILMSGGYGMCIWMWDMCPTPVPNIDIWIH